VVIYKTCFRGIGGDAVNVPGGTLTNIHVLGCTISGSGSDGVEFVVIPAGLAVIADTIISGSGGYGINNSTGTNTNIIYRSHNDFYSNTSGNENGFGDSPSFAEQSESSSPFTNAAGGDFSLTTTALARAAAIPGAFENLGTTSYASIGAWQAAAGGGTNIFSRRKSKGGRL
jgi:hypothetical protein